MTPRRHPLVGYGGGERNHPNQRQVLEEGGRGVALKRAHSEHGCTGAHQWGTNEPQLIFPVRAARPRSLGEQNHCFRRDPRSPEYGKWKSSRAPYRPSVALHLVGESSTTEASQGQKECGGPRL